MSKHEGCSGANAVGAGTERRGGRVAKLIAGKGRAALHCRNDSIASVLAGCELIRRLPPE